MALNQTTQFAVATLFFGVLSFLFDVFAELKKPPSGTPIQGKDVVICKFPNDPTVALGALSTIAIIICAVIGVLSLFFPYKGKSIPKNVLFQSTLLFVFFNVAVGVSLAGAGMTLWATLTEALHHIRNVHHNLESQCPTAKTGLFGGAGFVNLDASLFWLVCLMLTLNVREDHFSEDEEGESTGKYSEAATTEFLT
ncbi:uncharacterized protein LOC109728002 [Ananas comosus]|uniref:Uncharacterized protein LOC109728002 n=1 Tax=Ananas comosus TaxID=4615 RepID=A0A6P5H196_ANACO|nr:uncharacterized protein LOC109728002 [Ananas comosus]